VLGPVKLFRMLFHVPNQDAESLIDVDVVLREAEHRLSL
jgi:hypothetical protein